MLKGHRWKRGSCLVGLNWNENLTKFRTLLLHVFVEALVCACVYPPCKLTWHLKMYFPLKMVIFQCHVSFQGCKLFVKSCSFTLNEGWKLESKVIPLTLKSPDIGSDIGNPEAVWFRLTGARQDVRKCSAWASEKSWRCFPCTYISTVACSLVTWSENFWVMWVFEDFNREIVQ